MANVKRVKEFFPEVKKAIAHEGPDSKNPLAFKHYSAKKKVMGKAMAEHLRFAVCYWHGFKNPLGDPFGPGTRRMPWETGGDPMAIAENTMHAAFEFFTKLGVGFWCFHDRDIAPEADSLAETNRRLDQIVNLAKKKQRETGVKLLWGTTNAFSHPRFMAGASTNPDPHVFAYACAQVKKAMECTKELKGAGYVFWGGREGYETLLNTDLKRETDHLARFLRMAVEHKRTIGFKGALYIEPKPKEPTKHQYDYDAQSVHAFLLNHGLEKDFKLNIEANHATLAGHTFHHDLVYAAENGLLGSIDANRGDLLLGWDTDQFPTDLYDCTLAMLTVLRSGGFKTGGLNFDAKLRRQSIDPIDMFHAHIGAMDAFARGLEIAAKILKDGKFEKFIAKRYSGWDTALGRRIERGQATFADMEKHIHEHGEPTPHSGRQEMLENILNEYIR